MSGRSYAGLLFLVLTLAGLVRGYDVDRAAYWNDEYASLVASNGQLVWASQARVGRYAAGRPQPTRIGDALPVPEIAHALVADNHPPFYFLLLRLFRGFAGDGEIATRGLSVALSLVALALFADTARSLLGPAAALWAALLVALALPDVAMARETRSYSLLLTCVMLAAAALARLETRGPSRARAFAFGLGALAAMLTHYFAAFALAALAVHALLRLRGAARRQALAALLLAAALFLAAWGPSLWLSREVAVANADWLGALGDAPVQQTWARLASLPARLLVGPIWAQTPGAAWPVVFYAVVAWALWRDPRAGLFGALFCGCIGAVAGLDLLRETRQLVVIRYVLPATPALCAIAASLVSRGRRFAIVPAALALLLAFNLPAAYPVGEAVWRRFARAFDREAPVAEPVVLTFRDRAMPLAERALSHYGDGRRTLFVVSKQPSALAISRLPQRGAFWLVTDADPLGLIPGARIDRQVSTPGPLPVYRMTLEAP